MVATPTGARHTAAPLYFHVRSALLVMLGVVALPALAQEAKPAGELSEILVQAKRDDTASSTRNGSTTVISSRQLEQNNATDLGSIAR
jgi:hemoglobin/transferrin/lactoferrin receptor protein